MHNRAGQQTNAMADSVKSLFARDAAISNYYNKIMAGGKWDHMMDQTHIGYTYWQEPRTNKIPAVTQIDLPAVAGMGVAIEGSASWWPNEQGMATLPEFSPYPNSAHYIELFNRGQASFDYTVKSGAPWVTVLPKSGKIDKQQRLWVKVDWSKAPAGVKQIPITITGANGNKVIVQAIVNRRAHVKPGQLNGYVESNGYVSIEAPHYSKAVNAGPVTWGNLPDYGRTLSGVTPFPVTANSQTPGGASPRLEYRVNLTDTGMVKVAAYISPTLNFNNTQGLRYAVSFDDEQPQIVNIHTDSSEAAWGKDVSNNIKIMVSAHHIGKPGIHTLKFWMVDPAVVLQKLVINTGGEKPSYLGPPESFYSKN